MIIGCKINWSMNILDCITEILQNSKDMNFLNVLTFRSSAFIVDIQEEPVKLLVLDMYSPFDFVFPKTLKRFCLKKSLKKYDYSDKIEFLSDQQIMYLLLNHRKIIQL